MPAEEQQAYSYGLRESGVSSLSSAVNNLTDATCLMFAIDDDQISLGALAMCILNNKGNFVDVADSKGVTSQLDMVDFVLNNKNSGQLDFGVMLPSSDGSEPERAKYDFSKFLYKEKYKDLVLKIVDLNEGIDLAQGNRDSLSRFEAEAYDLNIILLDKVEERAKVLEYMVRVQHLQIANNGPNDFLTPEVDVEIIRKYLLNPGVSSLIQIISQENISRDLIQRYRQRQDA